MNWNYYVMILFVPVLIVLGIVFEQINVFEIIIMGIFSFMIYLFVNQCKKDSDNLENEYVD